MRNSEARGSGIQLETGCHQQSATHLLAIPLNCLNLLSFSPSLPFFLSLPTSSFLLCNQFLGFLLLLSVLHFVSYSRRIKILPLVGSSLICIFFISVCFFGFFLFCSVTEIVCFCTFSRKFSGIFVLYALVMTINDRNLRLICLFFHYFCKLHRFEVLVSGSYNLFFFFLSSDFWLTTNEGKINEKNFPDFVTYRLSMLSKFRGNHTYMIDCKFEETG